MFLVIDGDGMIVAQAHTADGIEFHDNHGFADGVTFFGDKGSLEIVEVAGVVGSVVWQHYRDGRVVDLNPPPPPTPPPTDEEKRARCDEARRVRQMRENAGTALDGVPLATDERSLLKAMGAVVLFGADPTLTKVDFEAQPGVWVELDAEKMKAAAVKIGRHVQGCFSHQRALEKRILAAKTRDKLDAINVFEGWPT